MVDARAICRSARSLMLSWLGSAARSCSIVTGMMRLRFQRDSGERTNVDASPDPRVEMRVLIILAASATMFAASPVEGQDTTFRAMQQRGKMAMGVDQYTSAH